jgi:hypothetical protein
MSFAAAASSSATTASASRPHPASRSRAASFLAFATDRAMVRRHFDERAIALVHARDEPGSAFVDISHGGSCQSPKYITRLSSLQARALSRDLLL